jgi:hypothetical protein
MTVFDAVHPHFDVCMCAGASCTWEVLHTK